MILKENSNTRGYLEKKIDRYRLSGVTSLADLPPVSCNSLFHLLTTCLPPGSHSLFLPACLLA